MTWYKTTAREQERKGCAHPQLLEGVAEEGLALADAGGAHGAEEEYGNAQEHAATRCKADVAARKREPAQPRLHVRPQGLVKVFGEGAFQLHYEGCMPRHGAVSAAGLPGHGSMHGSGKCSMLILQQVRRTCGASCLTSRCCAADLRSTGRI